MLTYTLTSLSVVFEPLGILSEGISKHESPAQFGTNFLFREYASVHESL